MAGDRSYAAECEKVSGSILPYVGTVDTARDLDRIRQALGDAQLTFIGHSYGTLLGATYAELYPTHVRAMVLDGAIDPAEDTDQMAIDQAGVVRVQPGRLLRLVRRRPRRARGGRPATRPPPCSPSSTAAGQAPAGPAGREAGPGSSTSP